MGLRNWLGSRRRNERRGDERPHSRRWEDLAPGPGILLLERDSASIGATSDLSKLFEALAEALPQGALLYLEGTSITPDVAAFLAVTSVEPPALVTPGSGAKSEKFHLPATPANLTRLYALSLRHATPEICDHLVVYREGQVLVSAYDAGFGTVYVRSDLSATAVERLREAADA